MIESGDHICRHVLLRGGDCEGDREAGLRGVLGQTIIQFPVADAKTPAEGLTRAEAFIKAFKDDTLIVPAVAPHAMYTNDRATLVACAELARKYGVPLIIHLAETEDEVKTARTDHQMTPAGYLESIGFWGPKTLAAHGVWVTDEDIQILKRHSVGVSHNPESNMKLASGTRRLRNIWPPASRSAWGPTARRATTTSTCSKRCGRRPFSRSSPAATRPRYLRSRHWTWPPSAGRRPRHGRSDWLARARQARRPDHRLDVRHAPDADDDAVSHLVYVTRRRRWRGPIYRPCSCGPFGHDVTRPLDASREGDRREGQGRGAVRLRLR